MGHLPQPARCPMGPAAPWHPADRWFRNGEQGSRRWSDYSCDYTA